MSRCEADIAVRPIHRLSLRDQRRMDARDGIRGDGFVRRAQAGKLLIAGQPQAPGAAGFAVSGPGVAGSHRNRLLFKGIAFRGDSGYLKYTVSDAGRNYHRSQGERTVGKASFSGFSTRAGRGPGRRGCAIRSPRRWRCRQAGMRRTRREPRPIPCHWRAKSGHRYPGPRLRPNACQSLFRRNFWCPNSYRIPGPAHSRNAGGPALADGGRHSSTVSIAHDLPAPQTIGCGTLTGPGRG